MRTKKCKSCLLCSLVNSCIHNISWPSFLNCNQNFQHIEERGIAIFQHFSDHKSFFGFSAGWTVVLTHSIASLSLYISSIGVLKLFKQHCSLHILRTSEKYGYKNYNAARKEVYDTDMKKVISYWLGHVSQVWSQHGLWFKFFSPLTVKVTPMLNAVVIVSVLPIQILY